MQAVCPVNDRYGPRRPDTWASRSRMTNDKPVASADKWQIRYADKDTCGIPFCRFTDSRDLSSMSQVFRDPFWPTDGSADPRICSADPLKHPADYHKRDSTCKFRPDRRRPVLVHLGRVRNQLYVRRLRTHRVRCYHLLPMRNPYTPSQLRIRRE